MIFIEQDAKRLLMERLDKCLKIHADMLDAQNIGSIYELQGFSELHYYLKAEHEFTPAEVEALLSFQDPLDVARWCWEENTHAHSFPICELLEEIQADRKFPKELSEPEEQNRKYLELMSLVGKDYYIYREKLEDCSNRELIDRSEEIASVMAAYRYLTGENSLTAEEIDYLLRFDRPLVEVVKTFRVADHSGAVSFLQILAPELTDRLLAELLDLDDAVTVNLHIQSIDQTQAIKNIKRKMSDLQKMTIEEQKKAVRAGYDIPKMSTAHWWNSLGSRGRSLIFPPLPPTISIRWILTWTIRTTRTLSP